MSDLIHYTYANSSSAWRTRIALSLKGLAPEQRYVHLLRDGGQQHDARYLELNPQGVVPTLIDHGRALGQSLAIIEYLNELHPEPPLLPEDLFERAKVRQIALAIVCDIHPLNNLRVRQYLTKELSADQDQVAAWYRHWIEEGFAAVEDLLDENGPFACGRDVTMADIALVPQVAHARKFAVSLDDYPRIRRAEEAAKAVPAIAAAAPEKQPDFGK